MDRRAFLCTLAGGLLAAPLAAVGKEAAKTARVGILNVGPAPSPEQLAESRLRSPFWLALKELGWVYGQNIVAETRWGESAEQLHAAAADLVRLKVDLLFTTGASLARILQLETKTIPIVVLMAGADLVADGLVASLARPGGNLTGSQVLQGDLIAKRVELLKTLVPSLSRVAFLQESVTTSVLPQLRVRYDQQAAVAASSGSGPRGRGGRGRLRLSQGGGHSGRGGARRRRGEELRAVYALQAGGTIPFIRLLRRREVRPARRNSRAG